MIPITSQLQAVIQNNREKIPVGMVWVYDTTYTVPSSGIFVSYYSGNNILDTGSLKRTQFEPAIYKDWSNGFPVELSDYIGYNISQSGFVTSDPFSVVYSGYFNATTSGEYFFTIKANGAFELSIDNSSNLITICSGYSGVQTSDQFFADKSYFWYGSGNLNSGWHNFQLNYYWNRGLISGDAGSPFISAYYSTTGVRDSILSASVLNIDSGYISPTIISKDIFISESSDTNLASTFSFEVAVTPSGEYNWDKTKEEFDKLKLNRLCKVFMGYVTEEEYLATSGYTTNLATPISMVEKFTGFIDSVNLSQNFNSITATVSCRDFFKKLDNALNENYPNKINYSKIVLDNLDPRGAFQIYTKMPMCYDAWKVYDVIETLALNAGIDPIHINRSKWDIQNYFVLESNLNWPETYIVDFDGKKTEDADPYLFQFTYGEKLSDELRRVADLVGYNVYFDQFGDLVFKEPRATNKIEIYETGVYGSRAIVYSSDKFQYDLNFDSINRVYVYPSGVIAPATDYITMSFNGVGAGVYYGMLTSGDEFYVEIKDSLNNTVLSNTYSTSGSINKGSQYVEITRNLLKDNYILKITPLGNNCHFEAFEYFTDNIYEPKIILRDDTDIIDINESFNDYSVRNEVICVGQQTGDKKNIYSKSIDIDSISNPDAQDYVGEKRTFVLIEPTIQSQKRLDWLSSSILNKYKRKNRTISVRCQGLPHVQINDPVGLYSRKINHDSYRTGVYDSSVTETYYVTKIDSKLARASYETTLTLTNLPPIESWRPSMPITSDILALIYQKNNNSIFDNFKQLTINSYDVNGNPVYAYDCYSEQAAFMSVDLWVDVDRLWILVSDMQGGSPTFGGNLYTQIKIDDDTPDITWGTTSSNPYAKFTTVDGRIIYNPQSAVWLHNGGGERWGTVTFPNAGTKYNDGQWIGQISTSVFRQNGIYPVAIWAQFKTADGFKVYQGMWAPLDSQLDRIENKTTAYNSHSLIGNSFLVYTNNFYADGLTPAKGFPVLSPAVNTNGAISVTSMPGFIVYNTPLSVSMWLGPEASGINVIDNNKLSTSTNCAVFQDVYNYYTPSGYGAWGLWTGYNNYYLWSYYGITTNTTPAAPGYQIIGQASSAPWRPGATCVFEGAPPDPKNIVSFWKNFLNYPYITGSFTANWTDKLESFWSMPGGLPIAPNGAYSGLYYENLKTTMDGGWTVNDFMPSYPTGLLANSMATPLMSYWGFTPMGVDMQYQNGSWQPKGPIVSAATRNAANNLNPTKVGFGETHNEYAYNPNDPVAAADPWNHHDANPLVSTWVPYGLPAGTGGPQNSPLKIWDTSTAAWFMSSSGPRLYGKPGQWMPWTPFNSLNYWVIKPNREVNVSIKAYNIWVPFTAPGVRTLYSGAPSVTQPNVIKYVRYSYPGDGVKYTGTHIVDNNGISTLSVTNLRPLAFYLTSFVATHKHWRAYTYSEGGQYKDKNWVGSTMVNKVVSWVVSFREGDYSQDYGNNGYYLTETEVHQNDNPPVIYRNPGKNVLLGHFDTVSNLTEWGGGGGVGWGVTNYPAGWDYNSSSGTMYVLVYIILTEKYTGRSFYIPMNFQAEGAGLLNSQFNFSQIVP